MLLLPAASYAGQLQGRPVDEVLRELANAGGFQLVYNATLVSGDLRVAKEPEAGTPLELAARVLAPLGLRLERIDSRTLAVTRASPPAKPVIPAHATSAATELAEIVVTASRYALASDVPEIHRFLTQAEVEALPRLGEDVLKAVHRLPGAASNGLSGLAHIRGGEAGETVVMLDGLALYEPFHLRLLQGPASVLDERIVDSLDVYTGGFTAQYGDRMSAVIDARSVRPEADQYYELGLSLMHANALASQRFGDGRGRWLAAVRRSNLDEVADVLRSEIGESSYIDGFGRIDYEFTPSTRASLYTLLAADTAEVTNSADTERADASYANQYFWATLEHDFSHRMTAKVLASYSDVTSERDAIVDEPGRRTGDVDDRRDYDVLGLKVDLQYAGDRWLQSAGLDLRSLEARYDYRSAVTLLPEYPFPDTPGHRQDRRVLASPSGEHLAAYYTARARITDALTAELGLRWDEQTYAPDFDDQLGPRLNLAWDVTEHTRLLASWGRFQQFDGIEELKVEDGIDHFFPAQRADHAIVGLEHEFDAHRTLRAQAWQKQYKRLRPRFESLYDPLSLAPELRWDRVEIAPNSALAEGADLLFSWRGGDAWSGWLSYAWSQVTDRDAGHAVERSWDQTHAWNGGLQWSSGGWQATLALQYHSGWPVTPIALDDTGRVVVGPRNADRYADFASVDARIRREWTLSHGTLSVHAELTNALDRRNPCCTDLGYEVSDGAPVLERELRHWLPLVPSVGVLWKY